MATEGVSIGTQAILGAFGAFLALLAATADRNCCNCRWPTSCEYTPGDTCSQPPCRFKCSSCGIVCGMAGWQGSWWRAVQQVRSAEQCSLQGAAAAVACISRDKSPSSHNRIRSGRVMDTARFVPGVPGSVCLAHNVVRGARKIDTNTATATLAVVAASSAAHSKPSVQHQSF